MSLKLTLKPGEKIIINGAVVQNGAAKTALTVENTAVILRQKDILQEDAANSPAKRIYFAIQMSYLDESARPSYLQSTNQLMRQFVGAVATQEVCDIVLPMGADLARGQFFQALKKCKKLIAYEEKRLNYGG